MQRTHASACKGRMLRRLKQIWIAEAMLQLCYHKGASMACALQRIVGMQSTDAASKKQMLNRNDKFNYDV